MVKHNPAARPLRRHARDELKRGLDVLIDGF
jgi:hypothetical protein